MELWFCCRTCCSVAESSRVCDDSMDSKWRIIEKPGKMDDFYVFSNAAELHYAYGRIKVTPLQRLLNLESNSGIVHCRICSIAAVKL